MVLQGIKYIYLNKKTPRIDLYCACNSYSKIELKKISAFLEMEQIIARGISIGEKFAHNSIFQF